MNTRVLIVDDQGDLRKLVRLTLDTGNYELHEAENSAGALDMVERIRPDIMILDVMMPGGMDGLELCHKIKTNPDNANIKIFLLTARGQKSDIEKGLNAGADGYLLKPFSPLQLIETVRNAVEVSLSTCISPSI